MTTPHTRLCSQCGKPLAPDGDCPVCALKRALALSAPAPEAQVIEQAGNRIGPYKLLEKIGEGGYGSVYMAEQAEPIRRRVALKIVKLGMDTKQVIARFEAERQALALMDHPNIARIFDAGITGTPSSQLSTNDSQLHYGRPYFVMELVRGIKITDYCDRNNLSTKERLNLFMQVCHAVQHAHQKGIIHRDLKPSNILVTQLDGKPVPKVIDFGIAKATGHQLLTDKTLFTAFQQFIGTPAYMSPEQAELSGADIDTRSDIYALGVLLYELLTGHVPFEKKDLLEAGFDEMRRIIREKEPPKPSTRLATALTATPHSALRTPQLKEVRGDLDWIVMKCLEKERARRYDTASGLAMDLERHLNHEPVEAAAPSTFYRLRKFARRYRYGLATAVMLALLLLVGVAVSTWQAVRAGRAEREKTRLFLKAQSAQAAEERQRRRAEETVTLMELQRAEDFFSAEDPATALAYLARVLRKDPSNRVAAERVISALTHRNFALPAVEPLCHEGRVNSVHFSPDGRRLVTASEDMTARIWDVATGAPMCGPLQHKAGVQYAEFSPDGQQVVTAATNSAFLWEARTGKPLTEPLRHKEAVSCARFSPDGKRIVTASADETACVWDAQTGQLAAKSLPHKSRLLAAEFSPDGELVVTASADSTARVWNARTGEPITGPLNHHSYIRGARFSPDGRQVVTASSDYTARIWDALTGVPLTKPLQHIAPNIYAPVYYAEFSPSGAQVLTASGNSSALLWDANSGLPLAKPMRHEGTVRFASFSPDGLWVATASTDNTARVWDALTGQPLATPLQHGGEVCYVQFSPDRHWVATASEDGTAQLWCVCPGETSLQLGSYKWGGDYAEFSRDGNWVVTASAMDPSYARVWNAHTGQPRTPPMKHQREIKSARFSPDGSRVVTASWDGSARVWDAATGRPLSKPLTNGTVVRFADFSRDGQKVVTASGNSTARIWSVESSDLLQALQHKDTVWHAEFSPDDERVVTASSDGTARIWSSRTGKELANPLKHGNGVFCARFSPDGQWVVTASADNTARIWEAATGIPLAKPLKHGGRVGWAEFSSDCRWVVTASRDKTARVWNALTGEPITEPLKHSDWVSSAVFSPDGRRIATGSRDGTARVWDLLTGLPTTEALQHQSQVGNVRFSPDGQRLVTVCSCSDKGFEVWETPTAPVPAPKWLPELAEAMAGYRLNSVVRGQPEGVPAAAYLKIRKEVRQSPSSDPFTQWGKWFCADRCARTISPYSTITVPQYVSALTKANTLQSLREAVRLSPNNGLAFARLARQTLAQSSTNDAVQLLEGEVHCRRAAIFAPDEPETLWAQAEVWKRKGQLARALEAMARATRHGLPDPAFWAAKGTMLEADNRMDEAIQAHSKAIELALAIPDLTDEDKIRYLNGRFGLLCRLGQAEAASADLDRIVALTATYDATLLNNLAWKLVTGPEWKRLPAKTLSVAQKAVDVGADAVTLATLGMAYYRNGQFEKAVETLQSSLGSAGQRFSSTFFFLAMSYHRLGQRAQAEDCYQQGVLRWKAESRANPARNAIFAEADATLGKSEKAKLETRPTEPAGAKSHE